jgi:hypothetical protein
MANTRRGKKINPAKNNIAAKDFAEGKKIGRPKQEWVPWKFDPVGGPTGYWRKVPEDHKGDHQCKLGHVWPRQEKV